MSLRDTLREKPVLGYAAGGLLVLVALLIATRNFWPEQRGDLSQSLYSTDDGQTWFADRSTRVPPFDHEGKLAMGARVYSYAGGSKEYCAYLIKYTPEAKAKLDAAVAEAVKAGKSAESVTLFNSPAFLKTGMLVKQPGSGKEWISYGDPKAITVLSIKSPDGSPVDEVLVQ